jgi:Ca2+-dependent lipid-binding protein
MNALRKVGHKIEAKTKKGPINGDLLIKVVEGRHLSGKDKGDMDPYCIVKIGIQKQKTKPHMKGGTEPQWGDELAFDIKGGDSLMKVKFIVKDKETLLDEKVGRTEIPLPELAELNGKWIQLINKKEENCGEIRIECKFTGEGLSIPDLREKQREENPLMGQQVIRGHNDQHLTDKEPTENEKEPVQREKEYGDQPATRKLGHQIEKGVTSGPIKGALVINIMEGRDLTGKDFKGKIDPYCQVKIGAQKQKNKTAERSWCYTKME